MDAHLTFLGACGTVTGSKTLIEVSDKKFLVDYGLFQGPRRLRELNWEPFDDAINIDAVILTHAHIDHSGALPRLVKEGFKGKIYCSFATADLCRIMLLDAAHLQEEDADYSDKSRHSRHFPAEPLYTTADVEKCLKQFCPVEDNTWVPLCSEASFILFRSGHILGSRFVHLSISDSYKTRTITFSGDIGNGRSNIIKDPVQLPYSDIVVMESTYGDRIQDQHDPSAQILDLICETFEKKGVLLVPAFSVGRTQELIFLIDQLKKSGKIPNIPVYVDSPMSLKVTDLYLKYQDELKLVVNGDQTILPFGTNAFIPVTSADDSMVLCMQEGPFIVISAAGMLTGGRIMHHLKHRLADESNTVLFVGFQADETKGRILQSGANTLRIHHSNVEVNAKIATIASMSAHADQENLISWLKAFPSPPKQVFINHGEPPAAEALREKLLVELSIEAIIPESKLPKDIFQRQIEQAG